MYIVHVMWLDIPASYNDYAAVLCVPSLYCVYLILCLEYNNQWCINKSL